jgi:hypothetical protein
MPVLLAVALYLHVSDALTVHVDLYGQTMRCRLAATLVAFLTSTFTDLMILSFAIRLAELVTSADTFTRLSSHPLIIFVQNHLKSLQAGFVFLLVLAALLSSARHYVKVKSAKAKFGIGTVSEIAIQLMKFSGIFILGAHLQNSRLQLLSLLYLFESPLLVVTTIVFATIPLPFIALPHMMRIRAEILGLAFLAAIIPFLNADSWQLITGVEWNDLIQS